MIPRPPILAGIVYPFGIVELNDSRARNARRPPFIINVSERGNGEHAAPRAIP